MAQKKTSRQDPIERAREVRSAALLFIGENGRLANNSNDPPATVQYINWVFEYVLATETLLQHQLNLLAHQTPNGPALLKSFQAQDLDARKLKPSPPRRRRQ